MNAPVMGELTPLFRLHIELGASMTPQSGRQCIWRSKPVLLVSTDSAIREGRQNKLVGKEVTTHWPNVASVAAI
jgi:hypothetical protein